MHRSLNTEHWSNIVCIFLAMITKQTQNIQGLGLWRDEQEPLIFKSIWLFPIYSEGGRAVDSIVAIRGGAG